jgi:hypothetical protein
LTVPANEGAALLERNRLPLLFRALRSIASEDACAPVYGSERLNPFSESATLSDCVGSCEKGIGAPLFANCGYWSMTGMDFDIISQRQDFIEERIHQLLS